MQIKEARDGARGPGDLGLRRPERSVDIELSIRPLHWLLCFSPAKSWGAAVGGSITPNF